MTPAPESFLLTCEVPLYYLKRTRLWSLLLGLASVSLASSLVWMPPAGRGALATYPPELWLLASLSALFGGILLWRGLGSDLLDVVGVRFRSDGIEIHWTHVPQLLALRAEQQTFFRWEELAELVWYERGNEVALKQMLRIELRDRIGARCTRVEVLVSDERNRNRCEKVLAHLPSQARLPDWLGGSSDAAQACSPSRAAMSA
jgi:hypothetical protein